MASPDKPKTRPVKLSFQEKPQGELSLTAYAFDRAGKLVNSTPVTDAVDREKLGGARVLLGPALPKGGRETPTIESLRRVNALEIPAGVDALPISADVVKRWEICFCFITGRVVRTINGIDYPVCHARVHACEVDRWPWFIWNLSEIYIRAIRNDLLGRVPVTLTLPPIPHPPLGGPPPPPFRAVQRHADMSDHAVATSATRVAAAQPVQAVTAEAALSFRAAADSLPAHVKTGLASESMLTVRQTLANNFNYIQSLIWYWPWFWYSCDEIGTVDTDDDGRFSLLTFYNCSGDKPDVYFSVDFFIGGVWQTVYNPPKSTGTYWDYPCGTEVTIHITDERVPFCIPTPPIPGKKVIVTTIGNNINVATIQGPAVAASHGLTAFEAALGTGRPFGGLLEIHTDFGLGMQHASNNPATPPLFYYRWSYRSLGSSGSFTILNTPVYRRYRVEPASGNPEYRTLPLGPVPGMPTTMFMVPPQNPYDPDGPAQWSPLNYHLDTPVAFFDTTTLGDPVATAGKYEMLLELFDNTGALIPDWTAAGVNIEGFIPDPSIPAPFPLTTIGTVRVTPPGGDAEHYGVPAGMTSAGMRLVLHIDNNPCEAVIDPISSSGFTSSDNDCGFYIYPNTGTLVNVAFKARHENNFAMFNFYTFRGSGNAVPAAIAGGRVGSPANGFTPDGLSHYTKAISVGTLLTDTAAPPPSTCTKAAFSETLHVEGMATNGWPGTLYAADGIPHAYALSNT